MTKVWLGFVLLLIVVSALVVIHATVPMIS